MNTLGVIENARKPNGRLGFDFPSRKVPSGDTETNTFFVKADGTARFLTVYAGKGVELHLGDDDHEQWIDFSPVAARELPGLLVWSHFGAADNPFAALASFAEASGISIDTGHWT
ncbi:MAG: hypothetical protein ACOVN4_02105 [Bosea sp. (in: a-proteobacteria)]|jgi:hypothetical protein